jgi:hypothetical protein
MHVKYVGLGIIKGNAKGVDDSNVPCSINAEWLGEVLYKKMI